MRQRSEKRQVSRVDSGTLSIPLFRRFGQIVGSFLFDRWQQINLAWPTPDLSLTPPPFQKSGPYAEASMFNLLSIVVLLSTWPRTQARNLGQQKKSGFWRVCRKYLEQRAKTGRAFIFGDIEHYQVMVLSSQRSEREREKCEMCVPPQHAFFLKQTGKMLPEMWIFIRTLENFAKFNECLSKISNQTNVITCHVKAVSWIIRQRALLTWLERSYLLPFYHTSSDI